VSLKLGNKDTPILKKITNALTPKIAKTLRSEADKVKRELNAELVEKKRAEIKTFMNKTAITAAMKRTYIVGIKLDTDIDALKRKIQDAERTLKSATGQRGRLKAELRTYLNTLNLTNEERKRIEGSVGAQTKSLTALKRRARVLSEMKQIRRLRVAMARTTGRKRNVKVESNARQAQVMRAKAAKAFKIKKEQLEKMVKKLPLKSNDKKTYMDKLKLPKAPLNSITSNLKKFVKNAKIPNKKKETYMMELK
jgi:chromosome segregation ATPase